MVFENKMLKESPVTQSLDLSVSESGQPAGITSVRFQISVIILVNKTTITTITTITSITTIIATLSPAQRAPHSSYRHLPATQPRQARHRTQTLLRRSLSSIHVDGSFGDYKKTIADRFTWHVMTVKNINKPRTNITGQEKSVMLIGSSCCRFWTSQGRWQSLGQAPQRRLPTQLHPARLGIIVIMSGVQSCSFDPFPLKRLLFFFPQREIVGTSTSLKGSKLSLTKKSSQYFLWRVCNHHGSLAGLGVLHLASLLSSRLNLSISHQGALMMLIMVIMMIMVIFAMLTI